MALIQCPECGQSVSDKAKNCIHCGYPLQKTNDNFKHRWRCANCGEMADSLICFHCGKSSKVKQSELNESQYAISDVVTNNSPIEQTYMMTNNVSESIFSNSVGWFRYNYDENRLEFLNHNTKLVVQTWGIPIDQWEALPSQRAYCENIVNEANQQVQNQTATKNQVLVMFVISAIIAIVLWYLSLTDVIKWYDHTATIITYLSTGVAVLTLCILLGSKMKSN